MKVFVTGGNGFIGSVVVRQLVSAGHRVVCLLRETSRTERIDGLPVERALGDVRDRASLESPMADCACTVHLAAPASWDDGESSTLREIIEDGTRHLLEVAGARPGRRVVVVSSTAAISASERPEVFDEQTEFAVDDETLGYAHAKHRAEQITLDAFRRGVQAVIVNPAEVYGPGDTALGTAGNLIDFATSTPVLVCRGGTSVVHVDDVAAGIIAALDRGKAGERYILGGDNLTIRELAELVLELVGRRAMIVTVPNALARAAARAVVRLHIPVPFNAHVVPYATRYWFVDNAKARRELGVTFRSARETLASTLDWLKASGRLSSKSTESS